MRGQVQNVLSVQAELAECPLWSVEEQVLYFIDILAPALHRFDPASGSHQVVTLDEHIGCFGLTAAGGFIAALRSGVVLLDKQGRVIRKIAANPGPAALSRFNDGRVDRLGRFWCGSMWEPQDKNGAILCRVDTNYQLTLQSADIMISNGLGFSPDNRWMYHSDTPHGNLYRYPIEEKGEIGSRSLLHHFDPEKDGGLPDGAAVDSEGFYWSALFGGGRIVRIDPECGEIVEEISLPVRWPTMVAFGGADLKTLYITSSREDRTAEELAEYPQSGDIFSVRVAVAGLPEPVFQGS
ncbi:MAG: 6-deoxy-6-sulfogluconolactonase [Candidatus Erwinia impunctatus]|nr:6-deoxy-6-sulfogluconolactonase [Culicoides impunctatus]